MKIMSGMSKHLLILLTTLFSCSNSLAATPTSIAQYPLFLSAGVPPLVLLTMGRDHKLYYEAYNDASDLNGDGVLDTHYKPGEIDYFGYFDSYTCYKYKNGMFVPESKTANKKCPGIGNQIWSGDFLNYITTSRIDALRKVLYGGYRSTDTTSSTILERSYIPQDAHSWGKEYTSEAVDGYKISKYTPLKKPKENSRHLFASVTLGGSFTSGGPPLMRVLNDSDFRIWEWVSKENPVAGQSCGTTNCEENSSVITDYVVKVEVCKSGLEEKNCKAYSDGTNITHKPVGILQRYGEEELMFFGLLTGSYQKNTSGGVLRKNISSFNDEVDLQTGIFTGNAGIIDNIDKLRIARFGNISAFRYPSGWRLVGPIREGQAQDWGNPVAEMMYEGLRYFAGKNQATPAYAYSNSGSTDGRLGLSAPNWKDPYRDNSDGGYHHCAKPIQMVISDINASYDSDQLPGSYFGSFSGDISGLNVSALADTIWRNEDEASNVFIGQSGSTYDNAPTAKSVSSFKDIRGLAPEEPTKEGSYYSASIALYGQENDVNPAPGDQNVSTFAVALASPLPKIEIPINNKTVTIVPFAKSVGIKRRFREGYVPLALFQPTNQIVDFYVEKIVNTGDNNRDPNINGGRPYGKFRINYEDVEQAADHDMDAIVEYEFTVTQDNKLKVTLNSAYAAGGINQHMGYVISGTTADGIYLEVSDLDTPGEWDIDYVLDTPNVPDPLPFNTTRTFTVGSSESAGRFIKHDPLWYAAKWASEKDDNNTTLDPHEWDGDNNKTPDNYFLVTNAGELEQQLGKAFAAIASETATAAAVTASSARLKTGTKVYQVLFNSGNWTGEVVAYNLNASTGAIKDRAWIHSNQIPQPGSRKIYSYDPTESGSTKGIQFKYDKLNSSQQNLLSQNYLGTPDNHGRKRLKFIRGNAAQEGEGKLFRKRDSVLGDIVNSGPLFVGNTDNYRYAALSGEEGGKYADFQNNKRNRVSALYFGAGDGMFHAVNAETGKELFTYIPDRLIASLNKLTEKKYGCLGAHCIMHSYFVDGPANAGDAFFNSKWHTVVVGTLGAGGKGIFALDVTKPATFGKGKILWEISDTQAPNSADQQQFAQYLGYTIGEATIVRMHNGKWVAIVANGYESVNQRAALFIIDIKTGELLKILDTNAGSNATPNGLSTPIVIDQDNDHIADYIYAGDLLGNMWKIDVTSSSSANWDFAFKKLGKPAPLFTAKDASGTVQPITAQPRVRRHPQSGMMLYFGTGKFFEINDNVVGTNPNVQTFYGIQDKGQQTSSRDELQQQTIDFEGRQKIIREDGTIEYSGEYRVTSNHDTNYSAKKGWYLDLISPVNTAEGERVVSSARLRSGKVIFVTTIPSGDPCDAGGSSWIMQLDAITGGRLGYTPYDVNNDGLFNSEDYINNVATSGTRVDNPITGGTGDIVNIDDSKDIIYVPGGKCSDDGICLEELKSFSPHITGRQSWRQLQ